MGLRDSREYPRISAPIEALDEIMGIKSRKRRYEIANTPGFPAFKFGRRIYINLEKLQGWIDSQEKKG